MDRKIVLEEFRQQVNVKLRQFPDHIPESIIELLQEIGRTGKVEIEWSYLKPVIATLIHLECHNFYQRNGFVGPLPQSFTGRYSTLLTLLESYSNPPWTLQRLVELLLLPRQIYSSTHKFMNSLEKLLSVTTTLDHLEQSRIE